MKKYITEGRFPVFDYKDGEVHFISIINKHYHRELTDEVAKMLRDGIEFGCLENRQIIVLIRWLKHEQDDLHYDIALTDTDKYGFKLTQRFAEYLIGHYAPTINIR